MIASDPSWSTALELPVAELDLWLESLDGRPPDPWYWWANGVRGGLGRALLNQLCTRRDRRCPPCPERGACAFPRLWQPERGSAEKAKGPRYPAPPWLLGCEVEDGHLAVRMRLFGAAVDVLWRFRLALELAGAQGIGPGKQVFRVARWHASTAPAPLRSCCAEPPPASRPLEVRLLTPTRVVVDAAARQAPPSFAQLFAATERRFRLAAWSWAGVELSKAQPEAAACADRVEILDHSLRWEERVRHSARQGQTMRLGGLVGTVVYGQGWRELWPWLRLAPVLHVGKLTTMGFGKVELRGG